MLKPAVEDFDPPSFAFKVIEKLWSASNAIFSFMESRGFLLSIGWRFLNLRICQGSFTRPDFVFPRSSSICIERKRTISNVVKILINRLSELSYFSANLCCNKPPIVEKNSNKLYFPTSSYKSIKFSPIIIPKQSLKSNLRSQIVLLPSMSSSPSQELFAIATDGGFVLHLTTSVFDSVRWKSEKIKSI